MNDHIDAWAGARKEIGLDLKLVRRKNEKETRFEGCGLKKERGMMRGERDIYIHEAFKMKSLKQTTKPGWSLLHRMLPKQPCIRRDGEKNNTEKKKKKKNTPGI